MSKDNREKDEEKINKELIIESISKDRKVYNDLDEETREDNDVILEAIKLDEDGEYSYFSFKFSKDDEGDMNEEIKTLRDQRESFQGNFPKYEELKFERKLGRGSFAKTYKVRIDHSRGICNKKDDNVEIFVIKTYFDHFCYEKKKDMIERDSVFIPYHRNIAPILHYKENFTISSEDLPDSSDYIKPKVFDTSVIIMKYHRKDLKKYVKGRTDFHKPIRNVELCYILGGILRGVKHLHENGIVHRDIHPENIFVSEAYGRIWIGDFGCCLDISSHNKNSFLVHKKNAILFSTSSIFSSEFLKRGGYEKFLAPEILEFNEQVDEYLDYTKSDLYSVGKIGKFLILSFYEKDVELKDIHQRCIDKSIIELILRLIEKNPIHRINYTESLNEIERLTKIFEKSEGEIKFEKSTSSSSNITNDGAVPIWLEEQAKYYFKEAKNLHSYGKNYRAEKVFRKSLEIYLDYFPKHYSEIGLSFLYVADSSMRIEKDKYPDALNNFEKCIEICNNFEIKEKFRCLIHCYKAMGFIYAALYENSLSDENVTKEEQSELINKAKGFYMKGTEIIEKHSPEMLVISYSNLARIHGMENDYTKAIEYQKKCISLLEEEVKKGHNGEDMEDMRNLQNLATIYYNLGEMYVDQKLFKESLEPYRKCMEIREKCLPKNHPQRANLYVQFGKALMELGDFELSCEYFDKALVIRKICYRDSQKNEHFILEVIKLKEELVAEEKLIKT